MVFWFPMSGSTDGSTAPAWTLTGLVMARRGAAVGLRCGRLCKGRGRPLPVWQTWASYPAGRVPIGGEPLLCGVRAPRGRGSYLVDPASSHMLVSKTKPCMSKYKCFYTVKLRMAH